MAEIDPRMVKWDAPEEKPSIDSRMVKWDDEPAAKPKAKPYQTLGGNPLLPSLMSIGQGATFGWGDDILGKLGAVDPERYRATVEAHNAEYPLSSLAGNIGGGMLVPFGAGAAAGASPLMTAMTAGAMGTAAQMSGDAKDGEGMQEGGKGALLGMALGPLALGGMKSVGSIGDAVLGQASKLPIVGNSIASKLALRRVAEAFSRDEMDDAGKGLASLGSEARLADAGGKSVRSTLDLNAVMPGKTGNLLQQVIEQRVKGRTERLGEVADIAQGGYGKAVEVLDSLLAQKQSAAAPLYEKVHKMVVKPTAALQDQIDAAIKLGAGKRAEELATANRSTYSLDGTQQNVSMRDLDHLKQGIDDMIAKNTAPDGKMNNLARSLNGLRTDMLKQADFLTGDAYKGARNAFAGPAALEDSLNAGIRFMYQDGVKLERSLASLSDSEREAFKIGAAQAVRTLSGTQGGATTLINATKGKNDNLAQKLRLMYGDDVNYDKAMKLLEREGKLKELEGLGSGSQTANRLFAAQDQDEKLAADGMASLMTGSNAGLLGMAKSLFTGDTVRNSAFGMAEPVRNEIGKLLLKKYSPSDVKAINEAMLALKAREAGGAALIGANAGKTPGLLSQ